jgi:hypothetical protein
MKEGTETGLTIARINQRDGKLLWENEGEDTEGVRIGRNGAILLWNIPDHVGKIPRNYPEYHGRFI